MTAEGAIDKMAENDSTLHIRNGKLYIYYDKEDWNNDEALIMIENPTNEQLKMAKNYDAWERGFQEKVEYYD